MEGQKWGFFPKDRTYRTFLHNKRFFLIAPRDLHYYWASAQPCAVNNTFSSLWEGQKWDFFPKDRTYRTFLHNKRFFLIAPRDLHYYWASAQPCVVNNTFFSLWEGQKWCFFPKDRTYRAFFVLLHKRNFFRMVPEGLNAFGTFVHAAESAN